MNWQETVLSEDELIKGYEIDNPADDHAIGCHSLAVKQAQITGNIAYKAGEQKVVKWIDEHGIWAQVPFNVKETEENMWCLFPNEWQPFRESIKEGT